jgi:hypothetical protein
MLSERGIAMKANISKRQVIRVLNDLKSTGTVIVVAGRHSLNPQGDIRATSGVTSAPKGDDIHATSGVTSNTKRVTSAPRNKEKPKNIPKTIPKCDPCSTLIKIWNDHCGQLPKVTAEAFGCTKACDRLREISDIEDRLKLATEKASRSRFCLGEKQWRATFDWITEPKNLRKVLDGNYDDSKKPSGGAYHGEEQRDYDRTDFEYKVQ